MSSFLKSQRLKALNGALVAIVGMGKSGQAAARLANHLGASVHCFDKNSDAVAPSQCATHFGPQRGIPLLSKIHPDLLVLSPGVPGKSAWLSPFKAAGIPVASELGFAASFIRSPIIAVTGTNGKSSCCWYIKNLLEQAKHSVFIGGNFGTALSEAVLDMLAGQSYSYIIAEVSSYQMEFPYGFRPKVSVLLNLTPDHLKRHDTMEEYARCKKSIYAEQHEKDWIIVDANHPSLFPPGDHPSQICLFGASRPSSQHGAELSSEQISLYNPKETLVIPTKPIKLLGAHNKSNIAAALLAMRALGLHIVLEHIYGLSPLSHRLEQVASDMPVYWINDSKATNIEATEAALHALMEHSLKNLWVILGGAGKTGAQYQVLTKVLLSLKAKTICFGDSRLEISDALNSPHVAENLVDVFEILQLELCPYDTVLFSPACASFDQYRNFEERGQHFKHLVSTHPFTFFPEST